MRAEVEAGVPANRIVLAGFSQVRARRLPTPQGGALALYSGLHAPERLGGIAVLSGYLANDSGVKPTPAGLDTPVHWFHGTADEIVRYEWAAQSRRLVEGLGARSVDWSEYAGLGHSASPRELADVLAWIQARVPPLEAKRE